MIESVRHRKRSAEELCCLSLAKGAGPWVAAFCAVRDFAALCPIAKESFKYFTMSALLVREEGPLSSLDSIGDLSPVIEPQSR